jgi:hypothetical protein
MENPEEGYAVPRISAQGSFEFIYLIEYEKGARVLSGLFSPAHEHRGNGTAVFNDRVLILPYSGNGYIPMALNQLRRRVIFRELQKAATRFSGPGIMAEGHVNFGVYEFADRGRRALFVVNGSADPVDRIKLRRPAGNSEPPEMILRSGKLKPRCSVEGETLTVFQRLEAMECGLLVFG